MTELKPEEVERLINRIGPSLGYDHTYSPKFPRGRTDVCAIDRLAENGSTYGYDTVYLVWKNASGKIDYDKLIDTHDSKDYMSVDKVIAKNNEITVEVSSGGSFSGKSWRKIFTRTIKN